MKPRLINANALMKYCQNQIDKKIDCNDIARFPTYPTDEWHYVKDGDLPNVEKIGNVFMFANTVNTLIFFTF